MSHKAPEQVRSLLLELAPHDRCMVVLESSQELAEVIAAVWNSGAALALLKPSATHRLELVAKYDPTILVTTDDTGNLTATPRAGGRHPVPVTDGSVTVFTSGTTGSPKGVVIPRDSVIGNAVKTARIHGFGLGHPHGTCLALFHVNALMMSFFGTLLANESLILDFSGSVNEYFTRLDREGARTASTNPQVLQRIVSEAPAWPSQLDHVITAAGPLDRSVAAEFFELYGPRIRQGYGLSEAVNFSFMMPTVTDSKRFKSLYIHNRAPVGLPIEGTDYRISEGELFVRTPDLMSGYLHDPQPANIRDGWLQTGDFAEIRDGFVVLLGRVREQLAAPGLPRAPGNVEDQLNLPVSVGNYAVVRVSGSDDVAVFASRLLTAGTLQRIRDHLWQSVSVVCGGELLLSPSGKVQRLPMGCSARDLVREVERALADVGDTANAVVSALLDKGSLDADVAQAAALDCGCRAWMSASVMAVQRQDDCSGHSDDVLWEGTNAPALITYTTGRCALPVPSTGSVGRWVRTHHGAALVAHRSVS